MTANRSDTEAGVCQVLSRWAPFDYMGDPLEWAAALLADIRVLGYVVVNHGEVAQLTSEREQALDVLRRIGEMAGAKANGRDARAMGKLARDFLNGTTPHASTAAPGVIGAPATGDGPADESSHDPVPLLQWIRGMCSDEEPHHLIDAKVAEAIERCDSATSHRERLEDALRHTRVALALAASILRSGESLSRDADDQIHAALKAARAALEPLPDERTTDDE